MVVPRSKPAHVPDALAGFSAQLTMRTIGPGNGCSDLLITGLWFGCGRRARTILPDSQRGLCHAGRGFRRALDHNKKGKVDA